MDTALRSFSIEGTLKSIEGFFSGISTSGGGSWTVTGSLQQDQRFCLFSSGGLTTESVLTMLEEHP